MNIEISKFYKGFGSAYSFVFDDGCYKESTEKTVEIFEKTEKGSNVKFKVTSAQTVGFINDELKEMWDRIISLGYYDVCSHSMNHCICFNEQTPLSVRENDLKESKAELGKMYPSLDVIAYATPGGGATAEGCGIIEKYYYANRNGNDYINDADNLNWYDIGTFTAHFNYCSYDYIKHIDEVISVGGWSVQMNHWLTGKEGDVFHSQTIKSFEDECLYLAKKYDEGDILIWSYIDAVKYLRERENSKTELTDTGDGNYEGIINMSLDPKIFNRPLTVRIEKGYTVFSENKELPVYERKSQSFFDILPNRRFTLKAK